MACGFVLVNDFLVGNVVNRTGGGAKNFRRFGLVASADRFTRIFDGGSQARAQTRVVRVELDGLTGAFAGLSGIGHRESISKAGLPRQKAKPRKFSRAL